MMPAFLAVRLTMPLTARSDSNKLPGMRKVFARPDDAYQMLQSGPCSCAAGPEDLHSPDHYVEKDLTEDLLSLLQRRQLTVVAHRSHRLPSKRRSSSAANPLATEF